MKVFQVLEDCEIRRPNSSVTKLQKDNFYISSDALLNQMKLFAPAAIGIEIPFKEIYREYNGEDLNNKSVLMMRSGGGGDILFMSTGIKELCRKFPSADISVAISDQYFCLVEREKEINKVFSLPIKLSDWNNFHYHIIFEGIIENNLEASKYNAYDLFMIKMSLNVKEILPKNKIPQISLSEPMLKQVKNNISQLQDPNVKRVGIQVSSSSPIRNYPAYGLVRLAKHLIDRDFEIYLFGGKAQESLIFSMIKSLGSKSFNMASNSLDKSIHIAHYMDYFVAPDSMFVHIGAALGKPVLGIYGPFPSKSRMLYFPKCIGIDANTACSPCFIHSHNSCPRGNPSPCFSLITPEVLIAGMDRLIELNTKSKEE